MDDWQEFQDHCYKVFDYKVSWYDAQASCSSYGANLASIHSKEENDFVRSITEAITSRPPWFGLYWEDGFGFKYEDESEFDYSNWDSSRGEPDEDGCVAIYPSFDYKWWDINCNYVRIFVCKK